MDRIMGDKAGRYRKPLTADIRWQLAGWLLFMVCAILFIAAGLKHHDPLTIAGSVVFLVACFFFVIPLLTSDPGHRSSTSSKSSYSGGQMPILIENPTVIAAAGNKPKRIEEYVGRVNSNTAALSIARMQSPPGWVEPGQRPEFDEYTLVLKGMLRVATDEATIDVKAGQAVIVPAGEWVRYSSPGPEGAEYIAVCRPAFAPETVRRDQGPATP